MEEEKSKIRLILSSQPQPQSKISNSRNSNKTKILKERNWSESIQRETEYHSHHLKLNYLM